MRMTWARVLALAGLIATLVLGAAPAVAGGGCHDGVTSADARGDDETTVEMKDACFRPTTVFVDPGTSVTFVSRDAGITHNVGGNLWGHFDDMMQGDAFRATFAEPGTYPYACSYHPGMTGAIVVGDGVAATDAGSVTIEPFGEAEPGGLTGTVAEDPSSWPTLLVGIAGAVVGATVAWRLARGRPAARPS